MKLGSRLDNLVKVNNDHLHMRTKKRHQTETTWSVGTRTWQCSKLWSETLPPFIIPRYCWWSPPSYIPKTLVLPTCSQQSVQGNYTSRQSLVSEQRQSQGTGTKQLTLAQSNPIQSMAGRSFSSSPKLQPLYKPPHPSTITPPTPILSSNSYHKART